MKVVDLQKDLKVRYEKHVILIKVGMFYEVYNDDCYVLSNLFNYNVKDFGSYTRAGFPSKSLEKVIAGLKRHKINYLIYEKGIMENQKFKRNKYDEYVGELEIEKRVNDIIFKLKGLKGSNNIGDILSKIEEVI